MSWSYFFLSCYYIKIKMSLGEFERRHVLMFLYCDWHMFLNLVFFSCLLGLFFWVLEKVEWVCLFLLISLWRLYWCWLHITCKPDGWCFKFFMRKCCKMEYFVYFMLILCSIFSCSYGSLNILLAFLLDCNEWLYRGVDIYIMLVQRKFCYAEPKRWPIKGSRNWKSSLFWFWG